MPHAMNNVALVPHPYSAMASEDQPSEYILGLKPSLSELCENVRVGTKWFNFGVLLNLNVNDLDDINSSYEGSDVKTTKMFDLWLKTYPNATRKDIISTLKKVTIGEITVADNYEMYLKELAHSITGKYIYLLCLGVFGYDDIFIKLV